MYIDESGTIPKVLDLNHQYFIIGLIHTTDNRQLTKRFYRSRLKAIKSHPDLLHELKTTGEIKGARIEEELKTKIYSDLLSLYTNENGEIEGLEFGLIIVDTSVIEPRFRKNKARCFNYLLSLYLRTFCRVSRLYHTGIELELLIDNQNVATKSTYSLQDYLNTELGMKRTYFEHEIVAGYYDSRNDNLIQLADFLANTVYRYLKGDSIAAANYSLIKPLLMDNKYFKFPL